MGMHIYDCMYVDAYMDMYVVVEMSIYFCHLWAALGCSATPRQPVVRVK